MVFLCNLFWNNVTQSKYVMQQIKKELFYKFTEIVLINFHIKLSI